MKQLKIIQSEIDSVNPFFTADFTESITINPGSKIWFDKISFNVLPSAIDGQIQLGDQTIQVAPNVLTGPLSQGYRNCYLPAASYDTIQDLYNAMERAMNGSLSTNPTINNNTTEGGKLPDLGLAYMVTPSGTALTEISFVQGALLEELDGVEVNMDFDGNYWWTTTGYLADSPFELIFPKPILAGALQCNTAVFDPNDDPSVECFVGLYTKNADGSYTRRFGFNRHDGAIGTAWRFYNNGAWTFIPDQTAFHSPNDPPTNFMSFFVDANDTVGHLRCGMFDYTDQDNPVQLLISPLGTFAGYDVTTNYYFGMDGAYQQQDLINPLKFYKPSLTYHPNTVLTNIGWVIAPPPSADVNYKGIQHLTWGDYQPFPTSSAIGPRNVRINFQNAQPLMTGLGFTSLVNYLTGISANIISTKPFGFVNFFDLALDVYNFSMESYRSTSLDDNSGTKGRVATVGYFIPVPTTSTIGETIYYAENKQLTFIDIKNKEAQVIESLQMRIYNPSNPKELYRFGNVSFTLFIEGGDPKEDGILMRL